MRLTVTLDIDPERSDGTHSDYQFLQGILKPLIDEGWIIHEYAWRSCDTQAVIVLKWGE